MANVGKASRLKTAYEYLQEQGVIRSQQDVCRAMEADKTTVSQALKGNKAYLTDRFLSRFNAAFDEVFQFDWLLFGEGNMLKPGIIYQRGWRNVAADDRVNITGRDNIVASGSNAMAIGRGSNRGTKKRPDDDSLTDEIKRLRDQIEKLTNDNMKLIERVNTLTDRLLEKM